MPGGGNHPCLATARRPLPGLRILSTGREDVCAEWQQIPAD